MPVCVKISSQEDSERQVFSMNSSTTEVMDTIYKLKSLCLLIEKHVKDDGDNQVLREPIWIGKLALHLNYGMNIWNTIKLLCIQNTRSFWRILWTSLS
jgi:hypothetical protein